MIIINNPNNPTGATIPKSVLGAVVDFAKARDIIVFSDEVYRPLFHGLADEDIPPSILSFGYEKAISTGSMSKAYSLAGIRLGWVASRDKDIMRAIAEARDYSTISVSQLDDQNTTKTHTNNKQPTQKERNIRLAQTTA